MSVLKTESNHTKPLKEWLVEERRGLLHAEGRLVALVKMAEAAPHTTLKEAFLKHLQQMEEHVERLKDTDAKGRDLLRRQQLRWSLR